MFCLLCAVVCAVGYNPTAYGVLLLHPCDFATLIAKLKAQKMCGHWLKRRLRIATLFFAAFRVVDHTCALCFSYWALFPIYMAIASTSKIFCCDSALHRYCLTWKNSNQTNKFWLRRDCSPALREPKPIDIVSPSESKQTPTVNGCICTEEKYYVNRLLNSMSFICRPFTSVAIAFMTVLIVAAFGMQPCC